MEVVFGTGFNFYFQAILAPDGLGTMKEYKYKLKNIDKIWKRYQLFELLGVPKPNQTPTVGEMVNLRKKMTAFVVGEELSTENRVSKKQLFAKRCLELQCATIIFTGVGWMNLFPVFTETNHHRSRARD